MWVTLIFFLLLYFPNFIFHHLREKMLTFCKFSQRLLGAKSRMTSREEPGTPWHGRKNQNKTKFGDIRPEFKFSVITLEIQAEV